MTTLVVDAGKRLLSFAGREVPCTIGRSGAVSVDAKVEGDGATPLGDWALCCALLRPDRVQQSGGWRLPWRWLRPHDGWCDAPGDAAYNRPVRHPYPASAEQLWRDDSLYDIIVILDHNGRPPVAGAGSAIFLHCTEGDGPTEGCVAIAKAELLALLPLLGRDDRIRIV